MHNGALSWLCSALSSELAAAGNCHSRSSAILKGANCNFRTNLRFPLAKAAHVEPPEMLPRSISAKLNARLSITRGLIYCTDTCKTQQDAELGKSAIAPAVVRIHVALRRLKQSSCDQLALQLGSPINPRLLLWTTWSGVVQNAMDGLLQVLVQKL